VIVYHVCTLHKLKRYLYSGGYITPPVRAWETLDQAERFSISTGRKIILRLKFSNNAEKLPGHFNEARVLYQKYKLDSY
jgi:hypothetical protein